MIALGEDVTGVFTNNDEMAEEIISASESGMNICEAAHENEGYTKPRTRSRYERLKHPT